MSLDKLWFGLLLPLGFCLDSEDGAGLSLLTIISCMMVISVVAGFTIVAGVLLGLTLRKTHCRCCKQSVRLEFDDKQESSYASLQQPSGDLYQTTSLLNYQHVDASGSARKTKKAFFASKDQTEDIYENL
ncbi:hypothetical protein XENOCAPTIV_005503 [Xenoophorus captivus]|uniref:Uncharacterized protein n=1 Tax=Xenoophorus captivus TaxID=1517983 RepID=A0ABV0RX11_9TELE